jgi:RimJ/RimL family protein N-acetyltransferase
MEECIRGEKILLRPLRGEDMPERAAWTADGELARLMGGTRSEERSSLPSHRQETVANRSWLRQRHACGARPYAIEVDGRYIGDIDFAMRPEEGKADLTVMIGDRTQRNKGYGTEAVTLLMGEVFADPRIRFVEVDVAPGNEAALAFWRKLGFREFHRAPDGIRHLRRSAPQSERST